MGCGCGGSKGGTKIGSQPTASQPYVAPSPAPKAERVVVAPPRQIRPVEYCVVNGGQIISCFETIAEAKVERASLGATSVITRYL